MAIKIEKVTGGYNAWASPPHVRSYWQTPAVASVRDVIDNLLRRGAHQTDIGDAFYEADPDWLGPGGA